MLAFSTHEHEALTKNANTDYELTVHNIQQDSYVHEYGQSNNTVYPRLMIKSDENSINSKLGEYDARQNLQDQIMKLG